MKQFILRVLSGILVISMLLCTALPATAVDGEEYISALRIIYADDYEEAKEILEDSEFSDYKLLKENLNEDSDEIGVWLAYKTTTDIEDAITDLAIMQMNGGYTEGNYQEMLRQSYEEYVAMGEIYVEAIEYFTEAYDAGNYLAEIAYRQLNFYNVVSEGIPEEDIPYFEGELLGDIFYNGIDSGDLATMFLQGNSYALSNIRSLISMGVSYNEDGKTYLEKVGDAAAEMIEDPFVFENEDFDDFVEVIAPTINVIRNMLKELGTVEAELNYSDDTVTDLEINYLEHTALAEMLREVDYLDDKTLYQFCLDYTIDEDDYSSLYPLVAALNDGQQAMTKVAHYYDVLRYSVSSYSEDALEEKLTEMEEKYGKDPFNVYTGVDRSVYYGTFALTSAASRADSYSETTLATALFGEGNFGSTIISMMSGAIGAGLLIGAIETTIDAYQATSTVTTVVVDNSVQKVNDLASTMTIAHLNGKMGMSSYEEVVNHYLSLYSAKTGQATGYTSWSFADKVSYMDAHFSEIGRLDPPNIMSYKAVISNKVSQVKSTPTTETTQQAVNASAATASKVFAGAMYVVGGAMMLYSAISIGMTIYNYYHPDYDDIPLSMVDLIDTVDGDRYIKYDVVLEAETNDDGEYGAGDLNAFEAQRWNALYYTKSYEAGQPLLADEFVVSNSSSRPKTNYTPVHRFGEEVCYDLNKYNFEGDTHIYLSVKQSKNNKSAVADVPELVGSMFGAGYIFLAGGIGAVLGIGGMMATQGIMNKKKIKATASDASAEDRADD